MKAQDMTLAERGKAAIELIGACAFHGAQALCIAGDYNVADVALGVARYVLIETTRLLPAGESIDVLPAHVRKCLRAAQAAKKAIDAELDRTIEIATVVPISGRA